MEWIAKYWMEALFSGALALLGIGYQYLCRRIKDTKKEQSAIKLGIQALLRDRIIQAYNHYVDKGYCPIYGLDNVQSMYKEYHALGGNGTVTQLVEELKKLPRYKKEESE